MKYILFFFLILCLHSLSAQNDSLLVKDNFLYKSLGLELGTSNEGVNQNNISFLYRANLKIHHDFNSKMGVLIGLSIGNIGKKKKVYFNEYSNTCLTYVKDLTEYVISNGEYQLTEEYKSIESFDLIKQNAYSIGIPFAIKLGRMYDFSYMFFGGEIEFPFYMKTRAWKENLEVFNSTEWLPNELSSVLFSVSGGVQTSIGIAIKAKFFLSGLLDENYDLKVDAGNTTIDIYPYLHQTNLFQFSLSMNLFLLNKTKVE